MKVYQKKFEPTASGIVAHVIYYDSETGKKFRTLISHRKTVDGKTVIISNKEFDALIEAEESRLQSEGFTFVDDVGDYNPNIRKGYSTPSYMNH